MIVSDNRICKDLRRFIMMEYHDGISQVGNSLNVTEIAKGYNASVTLVRGALQIRPLLQQILENLQMLSHEGLDGR